MTEEEKPSFLEQQPWSFVFVALLCALFAGVLIYALYTNPELNRERPRQPTEAVP